MTVRIAVDPDLCEFEGRARASFSDADGPVAIGDQVLAVEWATEIHADATVTDIDEGRGLVYLAVDWHSFRDDPEAAEDAPWSDAGGTRNQPGE